MGSTFFVIKAAGILLHTLQCSSVECNKIKCWGISFALPAVRLGRRCGLLVGLRGCTVGLSSFGNGICSGRGRVNSVKYAKGSRGEKKEKIAGNMRKSIEKLL